MRYSEIVNDDAFHGSPHLFSRERKHKYGRFRTDRIGSGEGMQAYGYGHYFTSNIKIAKWYQERLSTGEWTYDGQELRPAYLEDALNYKMSNPAANFVLGVMTRQRMGWQNQKNSPGTVTAATVRKAVKEVIDLANKIKNEILELEQTIRNKRLLKSSVNKRLKLLKKISEFLPTVEAIDPKKFKSHFGYVYHVIIPEDEEYLNWDNSVANQPQHIRDAIVNIPELQKKIDSDNLRRQQLNKDNPGRLAHPVLGPVLSQETNLMTKTGKWVYETLAQIYTPPKASKLLLSLGIAGIKFLAGISRRRGGPNASYNYVVFDDSRITIMNRTQ